MDSKKKKIIIIVTIVSILIAGIIIMSLVGVKKNGQGTVTQGKSVFYMCDKTTTDIYTLNDNKEKTKLVSDVQYITYSDQLKSYVMVDKDNGLYTIDDKGNKEKVSSDVVLGKFQATSQNKLFFVTKDLDLYVKEKDKDKEKLASNVSNFLAAADSSIIFSDKENSLFIKKAGKDKTKITSNIEDFRINSILNNVAYVSDGALYLKDIDKDEKDKLVEKNNSAPFEFAGDNALVYMDDYNSNNKKGELFYKEIGKDKKKIASDVSSINVFLDGVFYVNSDKTLYFKDYKSDNNVKILDDVEQTSKSYDSVFAIDKDKNLYKVNAKGEKEKLNQDVVKYEVMTDSVASTNKDKDLYVGNKKVASDVVDFSVNGKEIAYINSSKEVYLIKDGVNSEKVISDAKEYKNIQFNDYVLFTNTLGASDIAGCWKATNESKTDAMYIKFDGNNNASSFRFTSLEESGQYTIKNPTEKSMDLTVENKSIRIEKVDNDTLKIIFNDNTSANLQRISDDEYNKTKSAVDKMLPVAKNKFGQYIFFDGTKDVEGKTYYIYGYSDGDEGSATYFDENGDLCNGNPQLTSGNSSAQSKSANSAGDITYTTYTNKRYGLSIDHPTNLIAGTPPTNGDGLEFKSDDGTVSITASGINNTLNETAENLYNKKLSELKAKPGYTNLQKNSYVISWEENGVVYYEYRAVGGNNGSIQGFIIKYPKSQEGTYSPLVERIYKSFKPGDLSIAH